MLGVYGGEGIHGKTFFPLLWDLAPPYPLQNQDLQKEFVGQNKHNVLPPHLREVKCYGSSANYGPTEWHHTFGRMAIVFQMRRDMSSVQSRKLKRETLFHFNSELHKTKRHCTKQQALHGDKAQPRVARPEFRTHSAHVRRKPLAILPAFAWDTCERTTLRTRWMYAAFDNVGRFATASAKSKARSLVYFKTPGDHHCPPQWRQVPSVTHFLALRSFVSIRGYFGGRG